MKYNNLTPNLMVKNMKETLEWYRENLGFKMIMSVPEEGDIQWAMIGRDDVQLMLQSRPGMAAEFEPFKDISVGASLSFFVQVTGLAALYENIRDSKAIIKKPYTTFYGMEEIMIRDCNGYYFTFAEKKEKKS